MDNIGFICVSGRVNPKDECYGCRKKKRVYINTTEGDYFCKECYNLYIGKRIGVSIKQYNNDQLMCMSDSMKELASYIKKLGGIGIVPNHVGVYNIIKIAQQNGVKFNRIELKEEKHSYLYLKDSYGKEKCFVLTAVNNNLAESTCLKVLYLMLKARGV